MLSPFREAGLTLSDKLNEEGRVEVARVERDGLLDVSRRLNAEPELLAHVQRGKHGLSRRIRPVPGFTQATAATF